MSRAGAPELPTDDGAGGHPLQKTVLAFYAPNSVAEQENVLVKKEVTSDKVRITRDTTVDEWKGVELARCVVRRRAPCR